MDAAQVLGAGVRKRVPLFALLLVAGAGLARGAESYLLVVSGLSGDETHAAQFHDWAVRLLDAAARAGIPAEHTTYLAERVERDGERIAGRSTKEEVTRVLGELASTATEQDLVWIVLLGHGSAADGTARLNLPGPDMTAEDFAAALSRFSARVAFVNTSSSSGGFLPQVAGTGRAIVTATKSAGQNNETVFAEPFISALEAAGADLDKNGRVSLLEAFEYARQEVAKHYADGGLLASENALLEDNGDGAGSLQPPLLAGDEAGEDGLVARRMFFDGGSAAAGADSPELTALLGEREVLERRIEELRLQKGALTEELYLAELEKLLLALAAKDEEIRELSGNQASPREVEDEAGRGSAAPTPPTAGGSGSARPEGELR